jgi:hypothetical protein
MSLEGEIAAAFALAVLDVGANVVDSGPDGWLVAERGKDRVELRMELRECQPSRPAPAAPDVVVTPDPRPRRLRARPPLAHQ